MDVLIRSETDIDRRVTCSSEQLRTRMFVEHPFTECGEFLPLEATVLAGRSDTNASPERSSYDELLVPQGHGEVSIKRDPKVFGVVAFVHHDVF